MRCLLRRVDMFAVDVAMTRATYRLLLTSHREPSFVARLKNARAKAATIKSETNLRAKAAPAESDASLDSFSDLVL